MKKTLAILLALAMVFSTMTVAFAEGTIGADAQACVTLGMLKGATSAGVTADYLTTNPTRIQAAILFLRLKGLEADALAFTGTDNFADADNAAWAKPVMAYLKAHPEYGWVGDQGKFAPSDKITAQAYYKVMLEALGYKQNTAEVIGDFTWAGVMDFAAKNGLTKVATVTNFTVNDVAIATVEALKAKVAGSEKTLAVSLVDAKVITAEAAQTAGVYTIAPVALAVESVTALNAKEIQVVFNKEMDSTSAKDPANYELKDQGSNTVTLEAADFALAADKKTVTISVDTDLDTITALTNSTNAKLTVKKGILAADKVTKLEADYVNSTVKVYDGVIPEVVKAEAVGLKTIKLTMSEPVWDGASLTLTNGDFAVKSAGYSYYVNSAVAEGNTITLGLGTNLIAGDVTVTINANGANSTAVRDFAGIKAFKGDKVFAYAKDTTAPVVTVKEATQDSVTLAFNKPVSGANVKLYHSVKNVAAYLSTVTPVNAEDEITFNFANKLPAGTVTLYLVNSTTSGEELTDLYGNKVADSTYTANIVVDVTGPKVSETKLNTNASYDITFDENIDAAEAVKTSNFSLKKVSDGKDVPFAATNPSAKVVRITPTSNFVDNTSYEVTVKSMKDVPGNAMAATASYTFLVGDNTNPTATAFAVNADGKIYITFSEPMNETQMLDKSNYLVDVDGVGATGYAALGTDDKVTKVSDKEVLIDMAVAVATPDVKFATITDLAGKKLGSNTTIGYELTAIAQETVGISSAKLVAKNKIKLTFDKELGNFDNQEISLVDGSNGAFGSALLVSQVESMTVNSDGVTEVVLVLNKNINTDATYTDTTVKTVRVLTAGTINNTKSKTGTKLTAAAFTAVTDKVAPEVELVTVGSDDVADVTINAGKTLVTINFTENMKLASLSTLSFSVAGYTVTGVALNADNSKVELTVAADSASSSATPVVTLNYNIQDANGNIFAAGTSWATH